MVRVYRLSSLYTIQLHYTTIDHGTILTDDQDLLRGALACEHRDMSNHFLVRELVSLRDLNNAIQHQHVAICLGLEHQYVLELGSTIDKHLIRLYTEGLACILQSTC